MDSIPVTTSLPQGAPAQASDSAAGGAASDTAAQTHGLSFAELLTQQVASLQPEVVADAMQTLKPDAGEEKGHQTETLDEAQLQAAEGGTAPGAPSLQALLPGTIVVPVSGKGLPVSSREGGNIAAVAETWVSSGGVADDQVRRLPEGAFDASRGGKPGESLVGREMVSVAPRDLVLPQGNKTAHQAFLPEAGVPAVALNPVSFPGTAAGHGIVPAALPELKIAHPVGSDGWGNGLGDRVVWVVGNQLRGAEIHLSPPALGPLEVRVHVADGQANLSFMTHHAAVRDAIEAAAPRLREMLGDAGISMGSVSVNLGSFAQQQSSSQDAPHNGTSSWGAAFSPAGSEGAAGQTTVAMVQPLPERGLVDLFA